MTSTTFDVTRALKARIQEALTHKGHPDIALTLGVVHPDTLTGKHVEQTGGGCQAHIVRMTDLDNQPLIAVWTDLSGCDLPGEDSYMVGVYKGERITEDPLVMIEGPQ